MRPSKERNLGVSRGWTIKHEFGHINRCMYSLKMLEAVRSHLLIIRLLPPSKCPPPDLVSNGTARTILRCLYSHSPANLSFLSSTAVSNPGFLESYRVG